jgi:subtilase family serine protease
MAMKTFSSHCKQILLPVFCLMASSLLAIGTASAQTSAQTSAKAPARISAEISSSERVPLQGSLHPLAKPEFESGRLSPATRLQGVSIYFSRTQAQEADLKTLMAAQQSPSSPLYHQWLTPEQFGARFGLADSDIAKVQAWLEQQGFAVDSVGRSKTMIRFSGNVGQVEAAFGTEMHNYTVKFGGIAEKHIAASTALSLPSALAPVVLAVRNSDDFKPRAMMTKTKVSTVHPQFTSGQTGNIFLSPGDITKIYDVQPLSAASITGAGQTIAVMGQSEISVSDIEAFQTASGLTVNDPQQVLVPGTGDAAFSQGDEGESDLDLEWSGAIAPGAKLMFVYTGNSSTSAGVFDSLQFAVDNSLAQIISVSYGACEADLGSANLTTLETITSQAVIQGETILAASGDEGSTACSNPNSTDTVAEQEALAVNYPASSPNATGVGGTEFNEGGTSTSDIDKYWTASSNGNDVIASALSYIPEVVWNDDPDGGGISASGGGVSTQFSKPSWQTGVPGIPADGKRDVPDISLNASNDHDPYLFCTSDTSNWVSGQVGSCSTGFRDANGNLTAAGGTSFATPVFAGMMALVNEKKNFTSGLGLLNPTLYTMAANPTTYATAFHDITSGTNECTAGSSVCDSAGAGSYSAGVGYDLTTGLGTVDLNNFVGLVPGTSTGLLSSTTTVSPSTTSPALNATVTFTITVAPVSGSATPTGTVTIIVDSGTPITGQTLTANGTFVYTTSFTTTGSHVVVAKYSGDATYAPSTGAASIDIAGTSSGKGTFTISAPSITVARGSTGSSTVTVTPAGGYTGTVVFDLTTTSSALANACFTIANATVTGTTPGTTSLSIDTNAEDCATAGVAKMGSYHAIHLAGTATPAKNGSKTVGAAAIFAGLLFAGFLGRYSRKLRMLAGVILLVSIGFAFTGCGGSDNSSISNPSKGTYSLSLTGQDSTTSTITASTTVTLVID